MTTRSNTILIVEDDPDIAALIDLHLSEEGFTVQKAASGDDALAVLNIRRFDLLVLDVMLPGQSGLEVCRALRAQADYTPIIILSSRSAESQRILGLELGADDYLTKPFSPLELVSRVRALLRRAGAYSRESSATASPSAALRFGDLIIDPLAREARLGEQPIDLTAKEFDLLHFFARQPGRVFSRLEILNQVWGRAYEGYEHTVNSHINRLRAKVEADPAQPKLILTVWGVGYKLARLDTEAD